VLFCDDDVELECTFVEKLADVLLKGRYVCASGPLLEFFPAYDLKHLLASILGGACVMMHGRNNFYTRILKTGGWSYNHSIDTGIHKVYEAESLAWTCFMIKTDAMKDIHYEDEMWTERNGYAAFDDQTMFYKLFVNGYKTCVVSDAHYLHNDGKTSTESLKLEPYYAGAFNHYVFWHRYIYSLEKSLVKRCWTKICISYYMGMSKFYNKIKYWHSEKVYKTVCKGFADAKLFVKSKEYSLLVTPIINH
jgi:GT2 family glycosyltransferase